jgi:hypothetical protein
LAARTRQRNSQGIARSISGLFVTHCVWCRHRAQHASLNPTCENCNRQFNHASTVPCPHFPCTTPIKVTRILEAAAEHEDLVSQNVPALSPRTSRFVCYRAHCGRLPSARRPGFPQPSASSIRGKRWNAGIWLTMNFGQVNASASRRNATGWSRAARFRISNSEMRSKRLGSRSAGVCLSPSSQGLG